MLRHPGFTTRNFRLALLATSILCLSTVAAADDLEKSAKPATEAPIPIFINSISDLSTLLKRSGRPDFVILQGEDYNRLLAKQGESALAAPVKSSGVVESIVIAGEVRRNFAELKISYVIAMESEEPAWISIGLDRPSLSRVVEDGKDLPIRFKNGVWEVELAGAKLHRLEVGTFVEIQKTPEGNRLETSIPAAASTRVVLEVPSKVSVADAAPGEPLTCEYVEASSTTKLSAGLVPRSKLRITWLVQDEGGARLPPLLVAQAEMAVDVDLGSIRTRAAWTLRSLRGAAESLEMTLNEEDEVLELELDGHVPQTKMTVEESLKKITLTMAEPLVPGQERRLVLTTRRRLDGQGLNEVRFQGYPIKNAGEQSGVIGIVQTGNLALTASPRRAIRQIDPRTELPGTLRARPDTTLAYQFSDQPFDLQLRVEPSAPLVRTESRTTIELHPDSAEVDTWIEYQAARGRLFEVDLNVSSALTIESVGPEDVVGTWQSREIDKASVPSGTINADRKLNIRLSQKTQEGGRFSIHIRGREPIGSAAQTAIPLVEPLNTIFGGGRVAVLTDPSLSAELNQPSGAARQASPFREAMQTVPPDWKWPSGKVPSAPPSLWLRHDLNPPELPLKLVRHSRQLEESTALELQVGSRWVDVRQSTECLASFGTYEALDILVPDILEGRWEVEGATVDPSLPSKPANRKERLVRLLPTVPLAGSAKLKFHYLVPTLQGNEVKGAVSVSVPWIKISSATRSTSSVVAKIAGETGVSVACNDPSWSVESQGTSAARDAFSMSSRTMNIGEIKLDLIPRPAMTLPSAVVSRSWIRTTRSSSGEVSTNVSFRVERHDGSLSLKLPTGVRLSLAQADGEPIAKIEELTGGDGLRIRFPSKVGREPVLLELEYSSLSNSVQSIWAPPQLLGGGVVLQTFWETRLPWNQAVIGTPRDWLDENEWYWDAYLWKRRPKLSNRQLAEWISGRPSEASPIADPSGTHSYLFSRSGKTADLPLTVASRALLVGICSGTILLVGGFLIVVWCPPIRVLALVAVLAILIALISFDNGVVLLAFESGIVGLVLTFLLSAMQRVVELRDPSSNLRTPVTDLSHPIPIGSTVSRTVGVGPDDSTAIRARTPEPSNFSTADATASSQVVVAGRRPGAPPRS